MTFTRLKNHLAGWREWEMNPIVVKELRQAVRNWSVTGMLLLFLTVLFVTSLGFLVSESFEVEADLQLGGSMFTTFMVILTVASVFFIPLYLGIRVASERQENNPDLFYVSTLTPASIIRGKFLCGAYVAVLFFSACLPFMAFTNLLRGVDLPTVFIILSYVFLVVCGANMFAIFMACLPVTRPLKFLMALIGVFISFWGVVPLILMSLEFMRGGIGAMMLHRDFWADTLVFVTIDVAVTGVFYALSVALISPPSANRALPVRVYLTAAWAVCGLISFGYAARAGSAEPMLPWGYVTFALTMLALLVTISNSDTLSLRVRREIPQSPPKRALALVFFNGAAGGLIWVAGILIGTWLAMWQLTRYFPKSATYSDQTFASFVVVAAYAFAYALSALLIHRRFLSRRSPKLAGLIAILLAAACAIVPSIVLFFLNQLTWNSVQGLQLGNMFNVFALRDDYQRVYHEYFALGWVLVMLLLNAKWFLTQVKNFRPPEPAPPDETPPPLA